MKILNTLITESVDRIKVGDIVKIQKPALEISEWYLDKFDVFNMSFKVNRIFKTGKDKLVDLEPADGEEHDFMDILPVYLESIYKV